MDCWGKTHVVAENYGRGDCGILSVVLLALVSHRKMSFDQAQQALQMYPDVDFVMRCRELVVSAFGADEAKDTMEFVDDHIASPAMSEEDVRRIARTSGADITTQQLWKQCMECVGGHFDRRAIEYLAEFFGIAVQVVTVRVVEGARKLVDVKIENEPRRLGNLLVLWSGGNHFRAMVPKETSEDQANTDDGASWVKHATAILSGSPDTGACEAVQPGASALNGSNTLGAGEGGEDFVSGRAFGAWWTWSAGHALHFVGARAATHCCFSYSDTNDPKNSFAPLFSGEEAEGGEGGGEEIEGKTHSSADAESCCDSNARARHGNNRTRRRRIRSLEELRHKRRARRRGKDHLKRQRRSTRRNRWIGGRSIRGGANTDESDVEGDDGAGQPRPTLPGASRAREPTAIGGGASSPRSGGDISGAVSSSPTSEVDNARGVSAVPACDLCEKEKRHQSVKNCVVCHMLAGDNESHALHRKNVRGANGYAKTSAWVEAKAKTKFVHCDPAHFPMKAGVRLCGQKECFRSNFKKYKASKGRRDEKRRGKRLHVDGAGPPQVWEKTGNCDACGEDLTSTPKVRMAGQHYEQWEHYFRTVYAKTKHKKLDRICSSSRVCNKCYCSWGYNLRVLEGPRAVSTSAVKGSASPPNRPIAAQVKSEGNFEA